MCHALHLTIYERISILHIKREMTKTVYHIIHAICHMICSMYYIYVRLESLPASTLNIVWIGHGGGPLNVEYNLEHIVHFYIVFKNSIIILLTWKFVNNFYEFRDNWIFVTWQKLHILLKISSQWKGNLVVASYVELGERGIVSHYLKIFAPKNVDFFRDY